MGPSLLVSAYSAMPPRTWKHQCFCLSLYLSRFVLEQSRVKEKDGLGGSVNLEDSLLFVPI